MIHFQQCDPIEVILLYTPTYTLLYFMFLYPLSAPPPSTLFKISHKNIYKDVDKNDSEIKPYAANKFSSLDDNEIVILEIFILGGVGWGDWMKYGWRIDEGWIEDGWRIDEGWIEDGWRMDGGWVEVGWRIDGGWMEDEGWMY